jgi:acyl dehydratase
MLLSTHDKAIQVGENIVSTVRFSREDIAAFARLSLDTNPLHFDQQLAQRARFGEIIASGQQTVAVLMGTLASHFSRSGDGVVRQMVCMHMNFAFKQPVFADQLIELRWVVATVEWNAKLKGLVAHLDGRAGVTRARPAVIARGTILLTEGE